MFRRILIANRGEIALRIARTCRRLGVETVGICSEADRGAPWLEAMDASVCVGPARADLSYLDADAILQAAEQTECRAVHPGYGFLSENARFAARCAQHGIAFIGPGPSAIRRMGDKMEAKRTMAGAGVPTIPGSDGILRDAAEARRVAERVGYPVLLKASAGGGGKGMRRCASAAELERSFSEASIEAEKAFGNPALYLEKLLEGGRHVEFQILADAYGSAVHLGERECSVQRRHQKLIEESPSPAVDATLRRETGERTARAVAAFGYRNAGTVEFLLAPDGSLAFMEMNTRLQVEHPVTEMVYGIDLVEAQLRVAAGEPLRGQGPPQGPKGHAIEFRINAEDPDAGFRPDPGTIEAVGTPATDVEGATVRWDSAVRPGYRIPPHYDSMIGKLVVHAGDRAAAIRAGRDALFSLGLSGVKTTVPLHLRILDDPAFLSGRYDVSFLEASGLVGARP